MSVCCVLCCKGPCPYSQGTDNIRHVRHLSFIWDDGYTFSLSIRHTSWRGLRAPHMTTICHADMSWDNLFLSSNSDERGQDVTIFQSLKKCQPIIKVLCDLISCFTSSSRFHERVFVRKISECPLKTSHVLCPPAELTTVISQDLPRGRQYYDPSLSGGKLQPFIDVSQEADWGQRQAGVRELEAPMTSGVCISAEGVDRGFCPTSTPNQAEHPL